MEIGDIVVRISYGRDVTFKIISIDEKDGVLHCILKGINLRLIADSPMEDLEMANSNKLSDKEKALSRKINQNIKKIVLNRIDNKGYRQKGEANLSFGRPGRVLHIDGDKNYLSQCLGLYKQLSIEAFGKVIKEEEQPLQVVELTEEIRPDIVVLTGHDALLKSASNYADVNSYKNSRYFIESVRNLRKYEPDYDDLVIFAGACQSYYEAILNAGANFASSPNRVLIHCLDPVFLCEKISYTSVERTVSIKEALENTITGTKGIGGLQTRGKYREGYPKSSYI